MMIVAKRMADVGDNDADGANCADHYVGKVDGGVDSGIDSIEDGV